MKLRFIPALFKPSTRNFFREARKTAGFSLLDSIHGYIYGRWPYFYISVATREHRLTTLIRPLWDMISRRLRLKEGGKPVSDRAANADHYHGKVMPPDEARQLVTIKKNISLRNLEKVIPYAHARDIILQNPDHIVVLECPCRSVRANPCVPMDVCLIVGEPFAGFVIEHHPARSRRITEAEALEILREEHERGHIHTAFFNKAVLGRFYAICNCCSCCCGAMQAYRDGTPMFASSGYISRIDHESCVRCGVCIESCQFEALEMGDNRVLVNKELCMGCGVCVSRCDYGAQSLVRCPSKSEPLNIRELIDSCSDGSPR